MKPERQRGAPFEKVGLVSIEALARQSVADGPKGPDLHIGYCFAETVRDPAMLTACLALLSEDERSKHGRFYFEKDRHIFLVAHALLRCFLSRYGRLPPSDWQFETNAYGKPHIVESQNDAGLHFNISHTAGLVACALSRSHEVGIDVEDTERSGDFVSSASGFFSPSEVAALFARPLNDRRERFFSYWTLKESYIKARGMGLSIPLEQFSFELDEGKHIGVDFDPRLSDDPGRWKFGSFRASERHRLAYAVPCGSSAELTVSAEAVAPLVGTLAIGKSNRS